LKGTSINADTLTFAEDWINRAYRKREEADRQRKSLNYDISVSASQECIELSAKAIFMLITGDFQRAHEIKDDEFQKMLASLPKDLENIDFARIWLLNKFWGTFHGVAIYGNENLKASASRLFTQDEADLAYKHADFVYLQADTIRYWRITQRSDTT